MASSKKNKYKNKQALKPNDHFESEYGEMGHLAHADHEYSQNRSLQLTGPMLALVIVMVVLVMSVGAVFGALAYTYIDSHNNPVDNGLAQEDSNQYPITTALDELEDQVEVVEQEIQQESAQEPAEIQTPEAPVVQPQSYTNPFFPGFAINYPSDWLFNTVTAPSSEQGLLKRTVTLTKGSTVLTFSFFPEYNYACQSRERGPEFPFTGFVNARGKYISRYNAYEDGDYYAQGEGSFYYDCVKQYGAFSVPTNIQNDESLSYYGPSYRYYNMNILVKGAEFVQEADQIVANSSF